jgi:hypothetical protein
MALRFLVIAACFTHALVAVDAAQKMRPPLPKPKPAAIATPETSSPTPETSSPEAAAPDAGAASEALETQSVETRPAIVIPREKPPHLRDPASEAAALDSESSESAPPNSPGTSPNETRSAIVIPREKPPDLRKPAPVPPLNPDAKQGENQEKPSPGEDFALCRDELAELGAKFTVPEMPAADTRCTVPNPVRISAIGSPAGEVAFPDRPVLNCRFAKRFTTWVSDIAAPAVMARTGESLAALATGPGYECRGRNGDGTAKISEHAFGNAIDIVSFRLGSKESIPVSHVTKTDNIESRWLMALRVSACGYFTTVLGPGSNAAHAEHFHFDLGLHGKSGNYKICE